MATVTVLPTATDRGNASYLLQGDVLGSRFHRLFDSQLQETQRKRERKKNKKKSRAKNKEKKNNKRDKSPEKLDVLAPNIELHGNPSSFIIYASVRQAVLERQVKQVSQLYLQASNPHYSDSESEDEIDDKIRDSMPKMPKIVGIGLCGVFELIKETRVSHPVLCARALQALLDMLQGQQPEGLKTEPAEVIDSLYQLLMELSTTTVHGEPKQNSCETLTALACSCLLSLVIARGDTGKLLAAIAAALMSPAILGSQEIKICGQSTKARSDVKVPGIVAALQRSVQAVLLGKTYHPDWLTQGIREKALTDTIPVPQIPTGGSSESALASDGRYLYIHTVHGLYKVGSGFGDTIKGHVYMSRPDFHPKERGWLAYARAVLFYKRLGDTTAGMTVVNTETLQEESKYQLESRTRGGGGNSIWGTVTGDGYGPNVMFSDGEHIGHVAAAKDDSFVVRIFSPICNPMPLVSEIPLKLARKCVDVFGSASFDAESEIHTISTGFDEDAVSIAGGKDFALIRTANGKILYSGKCQALGIKQGGPAAGKWAELPITKSPKVIQYSVGHEGQHALLVTEDGSVFFVGTAKRGEDGDSRLSKGHRQSKPVKPKKMIKLEGKHLVSSACNSGTSAVVTRDGELYMFGKDTMHCDHASGHVTDLKDMIVISVSLGKAHAVSLTNTGKVFTFGINNKAQCGREYVPGGAREMSTTVTMADEEEEAEDDFMCPSGKHRWKQDHCMVCTSCGECTGYGSGCINTGRPDRNPGMLPNRPCGCGSGDSGCAECGVCRTCAGELPDADRAPEAANGGLLEALVRSSKDMIPIDLLIGRQGARNLDQLSRKLEERRHRVRMKTKAKLKGMAGGMANAAAAAAAAASAEANNSDYEQDHTKLASLPPSRVDIGPGDVSAIQVACGLQHTVVLLENGEVYTFGSNQYGQLGLGDTNIRGLPTKVAVKPNIVQVAAGSNHTLLLTSSGQVYTFGSHKKGQLGRQEDVSKDKWGPWFSLPGLVPGIGAKHGRRATWIGASGDQGYLRIDESLINAHTLAKSNIFANQSCIGLIPTGEDGISSITCLMINTKDGSCKSFNGSEQASLYNHSVCLDPVFDVLWSYSPVNQHMLSYNVIQSEGRCLQSFQPGLCNILSPELAIPVRPGALATRSHTALHMLGCLDTLTTAQQLGLTVFEEEKEKQATTKVYTKEDFATVNRFESHGGGWGYSGHSIEAVRFMPDTDILLGGFGLFGGRGEYCGKIKVFELGVEGGDNETDGELLAETEEMPYECGAREKFPMLFDEPVLLSANHWYVAWGRVSGPSSDCGSGGQLSITTEDQVVFKFKSSKKSNNGTDVNAGQIPQILYRLPAHDSMGVIRKNDFTEPAHILSRDFSRTVSPECFDSLLALLNWSWNTFCAAVSEVKHLKGTGRTAALLDLERLVYISTASLRLSRTYICEVYPNHGVVKKTPSETSRLAECVGDTRALLWKILADSQRHLEICNNVTKGDKDFVIFRTLANRILDECHQTFVSCFHAFYPTGTLKWTCLCDLLAYIEPGQNSVEGCGRLLAAVMEALCHPTVKLTAIMPINCEHETELMLKKQYSTEDNTNNAAQSRDACAFPLLVGHMMRRVEGDGSGACHWTFREVLDKLLMIIVMPVRQALNQERVTFPLLLVSNTCSLLSAIISELSASATGSETDMQGSGRPLLTTPNRFTRTSPNAYWNTGNGSPDAICFTVDRPGIVIAGVCVYGGGGGQYDYDVELLDDSESSSDVSHTGRWNSLELVKGNFGPEECINDIAEVKFDRPVPIKEGVKYAIRLRNRGPRTLNGDGGLSKIKCPDGTSFTFNACSLSSNGTNHTRGQIPQILYYSAPQEGENQVQNSKALAELQARKNAITVASAVMRAAADLLHRAQGFADKRLAKLVGSAHIFSVLLPMVVAYISPVAAIDPRGAVQVLGLVQEVLPPVAQLNSQLYQQSVTPGSPTTMVASDGSMEGSGHMEANTTSQHYAIVESDHPYKPATVATYKVTFPEQVKWMALEFDAQCGTAQVEDSLQLYIPTPRAASKGVHWNTAYAPTVSSPLPHGGGGGESSYTDATWWPVLQRFHGSTLWPTMAVVLPGCEVCFSLETASDYVKDDKACLYGFKCTVIGYEWSTMPQEGLAQLEREIACLGGMCAASLMRKDIMLPPASVDEMEEDLDYIDEGAQQIFNIHSGLLSKGFALSQAPSISQALEGSLPFCWQSNERAFLKDFVSCAPGTSGGRLAAWLQPESYLEPKQCDIVYSRDELRCSWPAVLTVQTKDQYGQVVYVPNLRVEVKAVPVVKEPSAAEDTKKQRRVSKYENSSSVTFGGHPPPKLDTPYHVTIKDKKDAFHAICMMKAYENYSFEELRFAAPVVRRPSENMLVRANNDGTYSANWTPGSVGCYNIHVTIDGFETGEGYKVEVKEPPQGVTPPTQHTSKKVGHQPNKMRKFVAQWSAGLRVRLNPSLQSEQIGVIKFNGVLSFVDEIHNDDGVWLRLSADSIKKWCSPTNGFTEAWALQYNQQLGKTLLVPVDEPKSILDEIIKETILRRLPELMRDKRGRRGGPGNYQVVKCGSSGHNIRCRANMKATPIGMLVLSNQVTAVEDVTNADGTWIKLDKETMARYCHEVEGESWALARDNHDITYLQHELDLLPDTEDDKKSPFSFGSTGLGGDEADEAAGDASAGASSDKGFDFSNAQQTPSFSVFGPSPEVPAFGSGLTGTAASGFDGGPFLFPYQGQGTFSQSPPTNWPTFGKSDTPLPPKEKPKSGFARAEGGGAAPSAKPGTSQVSPKVPDRKDSLKDIPPELQGVSVKDLVKALGKVKLEREINKAVGKQLGQSVGERVMLDAEAAAVVQTELKGVSVKDLIRLLGESRVNGNGATPPRTPPGTPKKTVSRSSSPKPIPASPHRDASPRGSLGSIQSQSPSPRLRDLHMLPPPSSHQGALGSPGHTPPRTPPRTPPSARRIEAYAFSTPPQTPPSLCSTPPQTPPSLHRELSINAASPKLGSPSKSPQRSSSSSPQRCSSPFKLGTRAASASPIRTGTSAPEGIKGHFSIGAASKDDLRLSPKASRKDRGRTLRSKRERAASPVHKDKTPTSRSRSGSLPGERVKEPVREAMSPSVAECMRAVFASFMWHEGIVHDAMACASFLKFHPNLPKEMPKLKGEGPVTSTPSSVKEGRVTPSGTLKKHSRQNSEVPNINEAVRVGSGTASPVASAMAAAGPATSGDFIRSKERCYSESKTVDHGDLPPSQLHKVLVDDKDSELPPTLQYLVYFWEELSGATLKVITQNLILPSPAVNAKVRRSDKKDKDGKEGKDSKKVKKKKEMKPNVGGRGNLFGEAAGGLFGGGERETVCELCGGLYPHPITYHMRQAHPGCGRHAGGQGYNSGGNYCGGWAGNCGDGGIGGSTWYLMCDRCREKFLREKRQALKEKTKKSKKKSTPGKQQQSVASILEPHLVMKNNAMFLLDLASAAGINLPTKAARGKQGLRLDNVLPSVSEDLLGEHCPFPTIPFLYLAQRGAHGADSAFAEDVIFQSDEFVPNTSENRLSGDLSNLPRVTRSDSMGSREQRRSTHLTPQDEVSAEVQFAARSAAASPESDTGSTSSGRSIIFQRSISEIAGGRANQESLEQSEESANNRVVVRRRNNSGGISDGGISLLKHPSAAMSKLIQSAEKGAMRAVGVDKALQKPVMAFIIQRHDLDSLQLAMKQALRKAACRVFALQAFNWLVRSVTQPTCLHDLLWFFVASLAPTGNEPEEEELEVDNKKDRKEQEQDKDQCMCEHPLSDITIAGEAVYPLPTTFHTFLQTISDVMMFLPPGSSLQQMAVRCWCLKFRPTDHIFLHKSHVFSNISKILSKSDEEWGEVPTTNENLQQVYGCVECLKDLTALAELKASSRQAMIASLTDNSTETFWESGDEDRNKTKSITVTCNAQHNPKMVYVHIDNSRDLGNKVSTVVINGGPNLDELRRLKQVDVEARHTGWVSCPIPEPRMTVIRLELKGPDNSLRLRQVKVLGDTDGISLVVGGAQQSPLVMQQKNCEAETLKVFRLLTSQVFGRLISDESPEVDQKEGKKNEGPEGMNEGDVDLKEHMVSILFSRSKLTHLQKQVCSHIVQAIRKESQRVQEEWEVTLTSKVKATEEATRVSDAYCFELLSMVLALSGSVVGRTYLAQQHGLIQNLLSLLHTASPRVQRQVTALLRRVLPEVPPMTLANLLSVPALPPKDFSILSNPEKSQAQARFDPNRVGILDVFLACIAKSLTLQTKVKGQAGGKGNSFKLHDCLSACGQLPGRWWLRGTISAKQAESIITLLKDMTAGKLSEAWAAVTKGAIAEAILALTKLDESLRAPSKCLQTPTLWLALASLCVLGQEHVDRLSSGQWVSGTEPNTPRPTCDNHDDGETSAIILCNQCGNLCADCDRFLHLHRRTRSHQRQVFKEEEEAIKVDLHEGCGRTKLFWLMALADSNTLKAMVEFREGNKGKMRGGIGTCRFCGATDTTGVLAIGNVCADPECQRHAENACTKVLSCGHVCSGIRAEDHCLPCLHGCGTGGDRLKQDADDMCMICFTEALSAAPAIQLVCGHVFHLHCCRNVLNRGWVGPRITFGFSLCPICKTQIHHPTLLDGLEPIRRLYDDVHRKALMRLEYEGLHKAEAITTAGARFHNDPAGYAMERYAYYVCYKCKKAYYGGEVRCEEQAAQVDEYDPAELVCGACSDVSRAQMCPKHGTDFLEYKCRYCCSVAVFFCFGTTHFCNACHDDFQRVTNIAKSELPHCPAGPKAKQLEGDECPLHVQHPPTGEEFALGCGVCRNAHTF